MFNFLTTICEVEKNVKMINDFPDWALHILIRKIVDKMYIKFRF